MARTADPLLWLSAIVAAFVGALTWAIWFLTKDSAALLCAIGVQLLGGALMYAVAHHERRELAAVLSVTAPVIGPGAAALLHHVRSEGGSELLPEVPERAPADGTEVALRLRASASPCAAIVSVEPAVRRAMIARLAARGRAEDVQILRWARSHDDPDIAVEVALAFEELGQRFDERLLQARRIVEASPSFEAHAAIVRVIEDAVSAGLVDDTLAPGLIEEARAHHTAALALVSDEGPPEPASVQAVTLARARLELASRRPERALEVLAPSLQTRADPELIALHLEAAYAARRIDLMPNLRRVERR